MKKEEKIQEAYGEYFDKCNPDENGWSKYQLNENQELISGFNINSILNCDFNNFRQDNAKLIYCVRPILLQGIENNNGWIKIESEDDLPKNENDNMNWAANENGMFDFVISSFEVIAKWKNRTCTHYQPIIKPQPPIY